MINSKYIKPESRIMRLRAALDGVEQAAQALRWRLTQVPDDWSVLREEVEGIAHESFLVSMLYGGLEALGVAARHDEHECDTYGIGSDVECGICFQPICEKTAHQLEGQPLCDECYDEFAGDDGDAEIESPEGMDVASVMAA